MSEKLYKRKYTQKDVDKVIDYIGKDAVCLFTEIRYRGKVTLYGIKTANLDLIINQANQQYNVLKKGSVLNIKMRDSKGNLKTIYHIEQSFSGLTYEILSSAENTAKWGYLLEFYKGGFREVTSPTSYKTKGEASRQAKIRANEICSLHGLDFNRIKVSTYIVD